MSEAIKCELVDSLVKLDAAYSLTEHNSPSPELSTQYVSHLKEILAKLSTKDQVSIFSTEHKSRIFSVQESIIAYQLGTASGSYLEGMRLVTSDIEDEIRYVYENLLPVVYGDYNSVPETIKKLFRQTDPSSIVSKFNTAASYVSDITNNIIENNAVNRGKVFALLNEVSNQLVNVISDTVFSYNTKNIESAVTLSKTNLISDAKTFVSAITSMINLQGSYTINRILDNSRR